MEPEESRAEAPEPAPAPVAPRSRTPRSRKPRTAAAAAAPTTAAKRTPRTAAAASPRSTTSRSAATGPSRRPHTAPVLPEERATVADALVELPAPEPEHETALGDEISTPESLGTELAEPGLPDEIDAYDGDDDDAREELAARVAADDLMPPPVSARASEPVAAPPVESAVGDPVTEPIAEPPAAETPVAATIVVEPVVVEPAVVAPPAAPAHELVVEPSVAVDRAASDAFRDLVGPAEQASGVRIALELRGLRKRFGSVSAVDGVDLVVPAGSFFGVVGPNGAGKTTTLSMVTGLLRPDVGTVGIYGHDMWKEPEAAKRALGVLPDRLRLFDRLTGAQLLAYTGSLRGMDRRVIERRTRDLATAFGLTASLGRPVSDYSLGMTKKIAIAAALLHAPRMLVLDEPFESVDPVSSAAVLGVLRRFTESGGTVILSSHSMELIESACDRLAIIAEGRILAAGTTAEVLSGVTLEDRFVELAGGRSAVEGMEWLHSYSDE